MEPKARTHADYTVGLVCTLPKEQTAAIAMLDGHHDDLPNPLHDHNAYTLGLMSKHNVVIRPWQPGCYRPFPSIRFGLMVGIGGGVPPKVRLGDVVVSTPAEGFPGWSKWDMGKAEHGDTFRQTGALNNTPSAILTALTKLESKHHLKESFISRYLEELVVKWPKLALKYARSEALEDVWFEADYSHCTSDNRLVGSNRGRKRTYDNQIIKQEGMNCRFCDRKRTLKREPRDMLVHYGMIPSGNQVIKDAAFRDKINARLGGNILCFEMNAAGLMNGFPCVVVRGICDYCDSLKNKGLQEHAAAVAAAFTKELLSVIPPTRFDPVYAGGKVRIKCSRAFAKSSLDQYRNSIRCWLSPIDYETVQSDVYRNYQEGTDKWFFDNPEFTSDNVTRKELLMELSQLQQISDTRVMLTSRTNIRPEHLRYSLLTIHADKEDIQRCRRSQIRHLSRVVEGDEALQYEIQTRILDLANGMFLLARLYISSLRGEETKKSIQLELDQMEEGYQGLDQAYHSAFKRIENDLAKALLSWVVCTKRVLTAAELLHTIAIDPDTTYLDKANFCNLQEIVSSCAGLVVVDPISNNVRAVHSTAKDYFQQKASEYFPDAHINITVSCLTYLGYEDFKSGACPSDESFQARLQQYPLLNYASRYWTYHAQGMEINVEELAIVVLEDNKKVPASKGPDWIHRVDSSQRTPLSYAAERGHVRAVSLLIKKGVKIDSPDKTGGTALHYSAWKGHDTIVSLFGEERRRHQRPGFWLGHSIDVGH
ncbi:purine and uridine phosphorylase [Aspergillus ellipticus CBS 707.79]|uniref:Purine and uridine phosphorylase n=1 Tax=Aspergillus ellipticus CBS 707.79 TaxID=1448320 RepID=A0A319CYD8_9EURO|nr:purine and uridine phosphorylase [Aspergillus ellipticus CBS 707.79]